MREHLGDDPFMVDANQQWDRARARRMCRELEQFDLVWIEEPLDAWDAVGHADLSQTFDTPIATGEMLTSVAEHMGLVDAGYRGIVQPDAPRIGGITPFLKFATLAAHHRLDLAPHYAMEIHLHLAATYPTEPWVEHFEWLNPLFDERIEIRDGQIFVPDRPGLGFTLTERMRALTDGDRYLLGMSRPSRARVVAGLKDKILAGDLAPGAKLPSESELIEEYAVSRTVVREAVTRLRAEGLVETQQGRGSFVLAVPERVVVHRRVVRDPHPGRRAGDARLPHRRGERGGRAGRGAHHTVPTPRPSRRRWPGFTRAGTRGPSRPTSPSTSPSRGRPATGSTSTCSARSAR